MNNFTTALDLTNSHELCNGTSIFTWDGDTARAFTHGVQVGMEGNRLELWQPLVK